MPSFELLINGRMVPGAATLDVINPATENLAGTCSRASAAQLDEAVAAARAAFPQWAATPIEQRREALEKVADVAMANAQELGKILTSEQGKPLGDAVNEAFGFGVFTKHFAGWSCPSR